MCCFNQSTSSLPTHREGCWESELAGLPPHDLPFLFFIEGLNNWTPAGGSWHLTSFFTYQTIIEYLPTLCQAMCIGGLDWMSI